MFTIIGGALNGQSFLTLFRAIKAYQEVTGWAQCWTSDPELEDGKTRVYLYPSEEDMRADSERAGAFIEFA